MNHHRSRTDRRILAEASEWFVEFNAGEPTLEVHREFDAWLRRSPEHIAAYLGLVATWEGAARVPDGLAPDVRVLVEKAKSSDNVIEWREGADAAEPANLTAAAVRSEAQQSTPQIKAFHRTRSFLRVASIAILLSVALAAALTLFQQQSVTYATRIGEQRSITLDDGSLMEINSGSRVEVHFSHTERAIDLLQGQALFQVRKDQTRPFVVHSGSTTVRAVGTEFDVYRHRTSTTVSVLEGRVEVVKSSQATPLMQIATGEQATVPESTLPAQVPHKVNVAAATAWRQHRLVFQAAALAEVISEFNRYNVRQMILTDGRLSDIRVSGVFSSTRPDALVQFLREQPGVDIKETEHEIQVTSR